MHDNQKKIVYGFEGFGSFEAISKMDDIECYGIKKLSARIDYDRTELELYSFTSALPIRIKNIQLPESLLEKFESRLYVYFDQLSRTRSGRLGSKEENKRHVLLLLKWWFVKYQNIHIQWAFFAAPPHLGVDMVLSDYLEWKDVPVRWGMQSLFPGFYSLFDPQLNIIPPSINEHPMPIFPECDSEELFYMKSIKTSKPSKLKWLESFLKAVLGDKRYSVKWANHAYLDGIRYINEAKEMSAQTDKTIHSALKSNLKFIYFPLHLQPEMTTSTLGGIYVDQVLAIEKLHQILPDGWSIIIKENPKQTFQYRPKSFFERIRCLDNAKFVGPEASSKLLIKHSQIVATITGTAGWEAIRLGKPTVVFGNAWYKDFEGVHPFNNEICLKTVANSKVERLKLENNFKDFIKSCHFGIIDSAYSKLVDFDENKNIHYLHSLFAFLNNQRRPQQLSNHKI